MDVNATLKRNTIIGDRIYPAGTPVGKIPEHHRGQLVDTMVVQFATAAPPAPKPPGPKVTPPAPKAPPAPTAPPVVKPPEEKPPAPAPTDEVALEGLKLPDLLELAKARGLEVPEGATRKQLIAALTAADEPKA